MLGAIAGDIVGSAYEFKIYRSIKTELFSRGAHFSDDTVLTIAVADCILNNKDFAKTLKQYGRKYPLAGYGAGFSLWLMSGTLKPYNSFGNGSAMRVSPVGFAFDSEEKVLDMAKRSAEVTHNHPEGIKGAQAIAIAIFLARKGRDKETIRKYIEEKFSYKLDKKFNKFQRFCNFSAACQATVPLAIIAFLDSINYEDAIRNALKFGGDSDTIACMAGGIAQAYYKDIPPHIVEKTRQLLPCDFLKIIDNFNQKYRL